MESLRTALQRAIELGVLGLEDSGDGERLERAGSRTIRRPSSLALWKRRQPAPSWNADATFVPQKGWSFSGARFEKWQVDLGAFKVDAGTQENGQIGIFPEHLTYFGELSQEIERLGASKGHPPRVLNLFAYTGLATIWCALHQADVTHIELSKRVLTWARENVEQNPDITSEVRFIPDDAVVFLEREIRRESKYDLIISDPPSFSRISKTQSWDLEEVIANHVQALQRVLAPGGTIFLTSHHHVLGGTALQNLFLDLEGEEQKFRFESRELSLKERATERRLPCGSLLIIKT